MMCLSGFIQRSFSRLPSFSSFSFQESFPRAPLIAAQGIQPYLHPLSHSIDACRMHRCDWWILLRHLLWPVRKQCIAQCEIDRSDWENSLQKWHEKILTAENRNRIYREVCENPKRQRILFERGSVWFRHAQDHLREHWPSLDATYVFLRCQWTIVWTGGWIQEHNGILQVIEEVREGEIREQAYHQSWDEYHSMQEDLARPWNQGFSTDSSERNNRNVVTKDSFLFYLIPV